MECGVKTDGGLPKYCCCQAFIDTDGIAKCKKCKEEWNSSYLDDGSCDECGYEGE